MFKKSNTDRQLDAFSSVVNMLGNTALKNYNDPTHWHNQFREQITNRIEESLFSILFDEQMGAPNASIRILIGMMILKEAFGWSDSQLSEQCQFNLLNRSALGLFNMNDGLTAPSTYYLLRKRIHDHQRQTGEDLLGKVFENTTTQQVREFNVNGQSIRMDSKLLGSNIAVFSRYEIIHQTLSRFYNSLSEDLKMQLAKTDKDQLEELVREESSKTVYHSTKEQIKGRLQPIGFLIYKVLKTYVDFQTEPLELLQRVFSEQYKTDETQQVELRSKEEISSSTVQSPHDPDSAYRNKDKHPVKGYSVNVAETCSEDSLNLITSVKVEKANVPDTSFVQPAIEQTIEVTGQKVEKVYADGAYQSPANDQYCQEIDMVFTGIQGFEPRWDLDMTPQGLWVTDTQTGEVIKAIPVKKNKKSKEDRWRIKISTGKPVYFDQKAIRASQLRRKMKQRSLEELHKRNNVEATIFQLSYHLKHNKSKYRGIVKQGMWVACRCLWINLVRIMNFLKQTCQRTNLMSKLADLGALFDYKYFFHPDRIPLAIRNSCTSFSAIIFLTILIL